MRARFDAGTDVAMLGAWDAERNTRPFTPAEWSRLEATLDADAAAGHLFLIHTHADGGGAIDVYADEPIPDDVKAHLTPLGGEFLLVLPTGALCVDGAEYYRARKPDTRVSARAVTMPPGDYALRCYEYEGEEEAPTSEKDLARLVGREDLAYYDRMNRTGCLGGLLMLLLFPLLWFVVGWIVALVVTVVAFVSYFHVHAWFLRRNERYARLRDVVTKFRLEGADPTFVLELRSVPNRAGLSGGSVSLEVNPGAPR